MADSTVDVDISAEELTLFAFDDIQHGLTQLLRTSERQVLQTARATAEWRVVSEHQFQVAVSPNGISEDDLQAIARQAWTTLAAAKVELAETGRVNLPGQQTGMRDAVRAIVRHLGGDVDAVDVKINDLEPLELVNPRAESPQRLELVEEFGSLTGVIDLVSVRGPRPFFAFRDLDTGRIVRAYYSAEQREDVLDALGELAEVTGMIRLRPGGLPVSVASVESILVYPPQPNDVHAEIDRLMGSVPDLLGDISIDDHLDQVRGREFG